jgi:hypothetical protein
MANVVYPLYKQVLLQAGINLATSTVKAALVDTGVYAYSGTHQYYSSISSAVVANSAALTGKTFTNGLFGSADPTFSAVTGPTAEALVLWVDTGTPSTSPLIVFRDTAVTGLPVTPNGGDLTVAAGAGWFQL